MVIADPCFLDVTARDLRAVVVPDVGDTGLRPPQLRGHPLQPRTGRDQFARPQG